MDSDIKEALDDARYRKTSRTPKGARTSSAAEAACADVEPDGPPFCVVEYDEAGRVVYTFPARYEGDTDEAG